MRRAALVAVGCLALAGCGSQTTAPAPSDGSSGATSSGATSTSSAATGSAPAPGSTAPAGTTCSAMARGLTREQQVGQLFMAGTTASTADELAALVRDHHVGSVLYLGADQPRSASTVAAMSRTVQQAAPKGIGVLVATDQEGGAVQRLSGTGFSRIPSATEQAALGEAGLQKAWQGWARELARAGVNYDLAPVADVVTASDDSRNAAIGALDRNYGTTVDEVGRRTTAVVKGMRAAGVASSLKHYPGLGRASVNTDFGVATDTVTTLADTASFLPAMQAGASSVMISSTVYSRIDPGVHGVFSSKIINDHLRGQQGWDKVVISDDLGAAEAVADVPAKERGVRFLAAGGDLVVDADPSTVTDMIAGVTERADRDAAFAAQLDEHAARVLALKAEVGLVDCTAG